MKAYYLFLLFFVNVFFTNSLQATHLVGGNFQIGRIDPIARAYCIQLYLYRDKINFFGNGNTSELADAVTIVISGTKSGEIMSLMAPLISLADLSADTQVGVYYVNYIFEKSEECEENFIISFSDSFVSNCVINTQNQKSTNFYTETFLNFEEADVINNSTTYQELPIIYCSLGSKVIHTPIWEDVDKDSLSVELVYTLGKEQYRDLQQFTTSNGTVKIDEQKRFVWDAPNTVGCFSVGLKVAEWRRNSTGKYVQIGYTIRYLHIRVLNDGKTYNPTKSSTVVCSPPLIGGSVNTDLTPKKFRLQIYPNPSADEVVFKTTEAGELYVYSLIGKTLKEKIIINVCGRTYINVRHWENGVYIFYFRGKKQGKEVFQKFVKVGS